MISIILTGHGQFAFGLYSAAELIVGPQENFKTVDFTQEMSTDELSEQLQHAINQLPKESEILFLTDLLGGSPFRSSVELAMQRKGCEVIVGTNLQMLTQVLMEKDEYKTITELATVALGWGKQGILSFKHKKNADTQRQEGGEGI
ncbi:PTS galactosamine/N-acetylgalactosamine transporter subunit IIA [Gilliamella sp. wkB112]|uniref:PTS galactosamine/N-acetylgalactosamine transporter subunit IIA n=1 Tax=Gilliamella sp. wkB112 TaxID=3120257 RepID=UPI00080D8FC8|nr:PTS galactosamine/N-acetylgalactosamine transporter subunit IIA [Gilliamella apicola]OCG02158.1 PTS N-acetylgalactosamine transporter subunit IIA [Gilliamella apicola]